MGITLYRLGMLPNLCICSRERKEESDGEEGERESERKGSRKTGWEGRRGRGIFLPTVSVGVLVKLCPSQAHMSASVDLRCH